MSCGWAGSLNHHVVIVNAQSDAFLPWSVTGVEQEGIGSATRPGSKARWR